MLECGIIHREATHLVGLSYAGPFPQSFPQGAIDVQRRFWKRRHEVAHPAREGVLFSPHSANESFATYWAAYQVERIESVPEDMVGITLPAHTYARVQCTNRSIGQGYTDLHRWIEERGHRPLRNACTVEVFHIREAEEEPVEIWIPIEG
ncbi:effector binding domain-containing protein [Paenibacillus flagellatus]|uniref:AraC family transcriptional regulator n=1 Tax=Paenibacillus flagellatus TaxID=2211139 RepID=A0A2V5JWM0_9BACL|nr:effector binding domain-containing protein [Paenibacillus flagellatus]PYI51225.1 AraC family transcriptional regulator [Paenibacillus flagellatus]